MKLPILLFSVLFSLSALSQGGVVSNSCSFALIICDGDQVPLSTGASPAPTIPDTSVISNPSTNPNPIPGNSGCLHGGEVNPNWFIIDVETSGQLAFQFSVNSGAGYLDWAMWEYDANTCQMIAVDSLPPVACNWNAASAGLTGLADSTNIPSTGNPGNFETPIDVVAGDQFIICLSNMSFAVGNLWFVNLGTAGLCQSTASLEDELISQEKELIKIVDLTGRVVEDRPNMVLIYMYSDGTSKRVFRTE